MTLLSGAIAPSTAQATTIEDGDASGGSSARSSGYSGALSPLHQAVDDVVEAGAVGALARVYDGSEVRTGVGGLADRTTGRALLPNDQFEVGSNTKTMMATMVLQLVAEKRLKLSDSVERLLPCVVPGGDKITLRMLLQHTSGLYNYTDDTKFMRGILKNPTAQYTPEELVIRAMKHPPLFKPGLRWSYSNTNILLVGLVLHRYTGKSPEQLLQERIVRPLGLKKTYLVTHLATDTGPGYAHGYLATFTGPPSAPHVRYNDVSGWSLSWAGPAGAVVSTAPEMTKFSSALLSGKLFPRPLLAEMLKTVPMNNSNTSGYGLGIIRVDTPCGTVWGHTGSTLGHHSHVFSRVDGKRTVVTDVTTMTDDDHSQYPASQALSVADENLWLTGACSLYGRKLPKTPAPSTAASPFAEVFNS